MTVRNYSKLSFIELNSLLKTQKDAIATYKKLAEKEGSDTRFIQYIKEREQVALNVQAEIDKRIKEDEQESRA